MTIHCCTARPRRQTHTQTHNHNHNLMTPNAPSTARAQTQLPTAKRQNLLLLSRCSLRGGVAIAGTPELPLAPTSCCLSPLLSTSAVQVTSVAPESFTELGWSRSGPSKPTDKVEFTLNLKARNMAELKRRALAAPRRAPRARQVMTTAEIDAHELLPDAVNRVKSWLADSGIEHRPGARTPRAHERREGEPAARHELSTYRADGRALAKPAPSPPRSPR